MRGLAFIIGLGALLASAPASGQPAVERPVSIVLNADPVPIVDARINGGPIRLEVDLRFAPAVLLNRSAANRLDIRPISIGRLNVNLDGVSRLTGRLTNLHAWVDGASAAAGPRVGIFAAPVSTHADGRISPTLLPYEKITIVLGPAIDGAQDAVVPLGSDHWVPQVEIGGQMVAVEFDLSQPRTVINRSASRLFDREGLIIGEGEISTMPYIPGVEMRVQPIRTDLSVLGLSLATAAAQTSDPLVGPDVIVVMPETPVPPRIMIGRDALAHCSSISIDRPARQLTLRCAPSANSAAVQAAG